TTGAIHAVDAARKKRTPPTGILPHLPPPHVSVGPNELDIYTYGDDLYTAMLNDIRHAKEKIFFEFFIVKDDSTGQHIKAELINAARRGVQVYIILDTWGNANQSPRARRFPPIKNLHYILFPFIRPGIITQRSRDKGRDHRKILTVDSKISYVGGYNIGTLYAHHWRDTHVRIEGPATWELENAFIDMWNSYAKSDSPILVNSRETHWDSTISTILNTPSLNSYPIAATYLNALGRARKHAWMTMGYFIPDEPMMTALVGAASRGIDVRILIPQYSNHIYADWVGRPHYTELLNAGVRIFLYKEAMVHAKTMTVDGKWSTVGTANIDRLSLKGNFEVNLSIYSDEFANVMEKIFSVDLTNTHELTLEEWNQRNSWARLGEAVLKPLAPLL
ncbi:MAG: phosphatidylserine/phosphatidylglycerophosphate/cardiolipin synthase family protein, partial [Actinomycetaceae bacterium]|nr:phosphatidylserine/phosphatidylglycerophosphate/cardiolipin synthase family protein [Actinomycetaceae bacterium]